MVAPGSMPASIGYGFMSCWQQAVDGCAGDLVKRCCRGYNGRALTCRKAHWESNFQCGGYGTVFEQVDETFDAVEQLRGGRLSEGYGDDVAGLNVVRQHQSHAPRHQGGLAATGACLDEQGCAVIQQRTLPRASIRKGRGVMAVRHHSIPQSGARSARRAAISGNFSSK